MVLKTVFHHVGAVANLPQMGVDPLDHRGPTVSKFLAHRIRRYGGSSAQVGFVSVVITSVIFALGLPFVLL